MTRPQLLDLFCGAGGAAVGYHRAGFDVVGVDHVKQPRYPFEFHQADAMTYPLEGFDAVHASPPCQDHSITMYTYRSTHGDGWMLERTAERLRQQRVPWIIENVEGAAFGHSLVLCGTQFGLCATDDDGRLLHLKRHRLFATPRMLMAPGLCQCSNHRGEIGGVYGGGSRDRDHARHVRHGGYTPGKEVQRKLMGIDWMTMREIAQAIPPAYTQFIGEQLLASLEGVA